MTVLKNAGISPAIGVRSIPVTAGKVPLMMSLKQIQDYWCRHAFLTWDFAASGPGRTIFPNEEVTISQVGHLDPKDVGTVNDYRNPMLVICTEYSPAVGEAILRTSEMFRVSRLLYPNGLPTGELTLTSIGSYAE
ncbi:MAG TPA: hypothetical protein VMZ01_02640 [Aestuariivirga sp.]|nr:hypothetical protein [Aestuariivirga sp.]